MIEREDSTCDDCCKEPDDGKLYRCPCGAWLCLECLTRHHPEMVQAKPRGEDVEAA